MDFVLLILPTMQLALGGALGGVARWILLQPKSWTDRLGTVALGAILGVYASPQIEPSLQSAMASGVFFGLKILPDVDKLPGFTAFATGVLGITLLGVGFDWVTLTRNKWKGAIVDPSSASNGETK